jgi:hypothetical protein
MTAVKTEATKSEEPPLDDLRMRVDSLKKAIDALSTSQTDLRQRRDSLMAERASLIVSARSKKDSGAQMRLYAIDEQLAVLNRDVRDDEVAFGEINRQLSSAQQTLERAEWEKRRADVRALIEGRLYSKTIDKIEEATGALVSALRSANTEDEAVRIAVRGFEPSLWRELDYAIRATKDRRVRLAAHWLREVLPIDAEVAGYGRDLDEETFGTRDRRDYAQLLSNLDGLELVF